MAADVDAKTPPTIPWDLSFPFPRNVPNGSARNGVPERSERVNGGADGRRASAPRTYPRLQSTFVSLPVTRRLTRRP